MMSRFRPLLKHIAPALVFLLVVCLLFVFANPDGKRTADVSRQRRDPPLPQETEPPAPPAPEASVLPPDEPEPQAAADEPEAPDNADRFLDVAPEKYYAEPVAWAAAQEITSGTSADTFSPDEVCTRAQAVTFLWRAAGQPAPQCTINPFADVPDGQFYTTAVLWAVENGITAGTSAHRFSPSLTCTRAQVLTFLHRAAGAPDVPGESFTDIPADSYYSIPVNWAVKNGITTGASAERFEPGLPCTRAQTATFLFRAKDIPIIPRAPSFSQHFSLYYADTPLDSGLECDGNRPYISLRLLHERFGSDPDAIASQCSWPIRYGSDGPYIALSDAAGLCPVGVTFQDTDNSVHLYRLEDFAWPPAAAPEEASRAYIRLEDIMADGGYNGRFTHENLNKLRFFGAYLRDHADGFYIAWIPLYVNPKENVQNDVSRDLSFYNADFVFTLDCLVDDGGRIGLHGLTHQHGEELSADGFEFGSSFDYSPAEVLDRFAQAERICKKLGYTWHFFEFPHYAASELQMQLAEERYPIVYQQYPYTDAPGQTVRRELGGHTCLWIPTPADSVHSPYDSDGIAGRLTAVHDAGQEISLFFHPVVDYRCMTVETQDDVMRFTYDEQNGILARILGLTDSWGYRFGTVDS